VYIHRYTFHQLQCFSQRQFLCRHPGGIFRSEVVKPKLTPLLQRLNPALKNEYITEAPMTPINFNAWITSSSSLICSILEVWGFWFYSGCGFGTPPVLSVSDGLWFPI
jgi:hypothetical protein